MEESRQKGKKLLIFGFLLLAVIVSVSISLGGADMSISSSLKALFFLGDNNQEKIIWAIRLPRILTALITGGGLAMVGAVFQGLFRNPMADPFVLGISSGAALGATIAIVLGVSVPFIGFTGISLFAFAGALLTMITIFMIARARGSLDSTTLLLSGIALNFFASSIIYLFMFIRYDKMKQILMWTFGSFSTSSWDKLLMIVPIIISGMIVLRFARDLNGIMTGETQARSFGVDVDRARIAIILTSTFMIGVLVATSGIIGFVGLMIPHLLRIVIGADFKKLLPLSFLYGSLFLLACDTLARVVVKPAELPIGAITALFGAPFFIFLLIRKKRDENHV
jgi:iron complex transport system permease protein